MRFISWSMIPGEYLDFFTPGKKYELMNETPGFGDVTGDDGEIYTVAVSPFTSGVVTTEARTK